MSWEAASQPRGDTRLTRSLAGALLRRNGKQHPAAQLPAPGASGHWPGQLCHWPARKHGFSAKGYWVSSEGLIWPLEDRGQADGLEPGVNGLCPVNAPSLINSFNKCLLIARPCASTGDRTRPCLLLAGDRRLHKSSQGQERVGVQGSRGETEGMVASLPCCGKVVFPLAWPQPIFWHQDSRSFQVPLG